MKLPGKVTLPASEMTEGPEAWTRFQSAMKQLIAVPHSELKRRIEAHRAETSNNPNRRGPKAKTKKKAPRLP